MYLHACSSRTIVYRSDGNTMSFHISFYSQIDGFSFDVSLGRGMVSGSWTAEESQVIQGYHNLIILVIGHSLHPRSNGIFVLVLALVGCRKGASSGVIDQNGRLSSHHRIGR